MIVFLAITSVVNLALGFALALYLLHSGEMPRRLTPRTLLAPMRPAAVTPSNAVAEDSPAVSSTTSDKALTPAAEPDEHVVAAMSAGATETMAVPEAAESAESGIEANPADEVEDDVLAGIEAFRAQLAQLKDEPAVAE
ncbi:MAG: hypothetical protein KF847_02920 [Pirellulales bacterium]|nr:hypothetical protein [Pirellulales bacterium]